ncbi:hypothetical protein HN588_15505 [Candidatus Bathyarchaeota archaeon]|jgi:DNA repair exonuclease SbcCD ATPase subunit/DNA repair exonuclease SbcCD nuclease subunit|nr:hypothetical protein [Candidatus Bathyarchaeota archaeon]
MTDKKGIRIAHLADIHWRGLSRHDEYRASFTALVKQLEELKPDMVYIGGDIFHSKTQGISPELVDCLVWFFKIFADRWPTHVILGNHDGIMMNLDRQDAISPIVTAMNHPNLFLYKDSGTFPTGHDGFNWCVFSCFDEKAWSKVKPVEGEVNMALFHGPVWGSTTDIDWKIEGDVETSFFDAYDYTLLGDIHKVQFLTEDKKIAYCGSTIQQNYGESPGKGFLLWDIRGKDDFDVEFHEVPHTKPFITVDWAGSVPLTMEEAKLCPKGARYRVRTREPIPHAEITQIKNELNIVQEAAEVVFQDKYMPDTSQITILDESLQKSDLLDSETHMRLLQEYLAGVKLEDEDWELIEELVRRYTKTIARDDPARRSTKWSVKKMAFTHTFAYGKDNVIDFDKLGGITGIFGRNRRGKSSVIGTLVYGLFNTTDRGAVKNIHVINDRKDYCRATIDFTSNGEYLQVDRQSVKKKDRYGKESAITHLNFWKLDSDGNPMMGSDGKQGGDLSGEQRRQTEKLIRDRVGTAEDFLLTSLASQGEMNIFIKDRATARKSTLTKFMGLDVFDKMLALVKEESSDIKSQVRNAPDRDWDATVAEMKLERKTLLVKGKELSKILTEKRGQLQSHRLRLSGFDNANAVTPTDVHRAERQLTTNQLQLEQAEVSLRDCEAADLTLKTKIERIDNLRTSIDIDALKGQLRDIVELEDSLRTLKHGHEREASKLDRQEKSAKILETVPCGDQFPTCKFIKNSHQDKEQIAEQKQNVAELLAQVEVTQGSLSRYKKSELEERITKFDALIQKGSKLRLEISAKQMETTAARTEILTLTHQIERGESALEDLKSRVVDAEVDAELCRLKSEISAMQDEVSKVDANRISIASRIGRLGGDMDSLIEERDKYKELRRTWRVYEHLTQAVSKRGIPLQIIKSQLPMINAEITKILQEVSSFTVELEADSNSNAMDVYIDYGDSKRIIEMASGMEKLVASLAIRVALINISSLPKTDMLIIDEGFGSLDDLNVEAVNRMLVSLKKWFRHILIITHVDGVKDVVDNVIDITWNGKDAKIVYE